MTPLLSHSGDGGRNAVDRVGMLLNDHPTRGKMSDGRTAGRDGTKGDLRDRNRNMTAVLKERPRETVNSAFSHNQLLSSHHPMMTNRKERHVFADSPLRKAKQKRKKKKKK